jgi:hypothetical protein
MLCAWVGVERLMGLEGGIVAMFMMSSTIPESVVPVSHRQG